MAAWGVAVTSQPTQLSAAAACACPAGLLPLRAALCPLPPSPLAEAEAEAEGDVTVGEDILGPGWEKASCFSSRDTSLRAQRRMRLPASALAGLANPRIERVSWLIPS